MAKKQALTKKDAEAIGIDLDNINPNAIPDNISPVIKAELMEKWKGQQEKAGTKVETAIDMPTAVERQNQLARERAEMEGEGVDTSKTRQGKSAA